jgi:hypothetical protein
MHTVECRSDYDFAGHPLAIWWLGDRLIVREVLNSWRTPSGKHYRVVTEEESIFDCCYLEEDDKWEIHKQ